MRYIMALHLGSWRNTEKIGEGQLLIEFLSLMTVVWCDTFVFLTIGGGQPGWNKKYETKKKKKKTALCKQKLLAPSGALIAILTYY